MSRILAMLICVGLPLTLQGRIMRAWSYDELRNEADLIVVATPSDVKETAEKALPDELTMVDKDGKPTKLVWAGIETTFEVLTVLKGETTLKPSVFHHYQIHQTGIVINGPMLVSFDPKQKKRFLLFVKREAGGRYVAVSGQTDPAIAVKELGGRAPVP